MALPGGAVGKSKREKRLKPGTRITDPGRIARNEARRKSSSGTRDIEFAERLLKAGKPLSQDLKDRIDFAKRQQEKTTQAEVNAFRAKFGITPKAQAGMRPEEELSTLYKTGVSDVTRAEETTQQVLTEVEEGGLGLQPSLTGGIVERGMEDPLKEITTGLAITAASLTAMIALPSALNLINSAAAGKYAGPTIQTVGRGGEGIITNTVKAAKTSSWLSKTATGLVKNPLAIAGGILALIGTYPFAGFIKEEALQTLSFATKTAKESGNIEQEKATLEQTEELLNPDLWNQIISSVPFANIITQLKNFYKAAATKLENDKADFDRRKAGIGTPEDIKFQKIREEQEERDKRFEK